MKYENIREEELKNSVAADFFPKLDCTGIVGNIDFSVKIKRAEALDFEDEYLLWAEAEAASSDVLVMLTQLVLTIGKSKTFNKHLPPAFLGCFDCEKIAFIPYHDIQHIFYQNDFNWNVASSNHDTKEFKQVYEKVKSIVENDIPFETYLFYFEKDEKDLKRFIRENFIAGKRDISKIQIDKNNFIIIFNRWLDIVKPTIAVKWENVKRSGLIEGDFYLADLLSGENLTIPEKLNVLLKSNYYVANRRIDENELPIESSIGFSDNQKAYSEFWARYKRPPLEEYWDFMIDRHDMLVPQDIRERKGSFYTPRIWVEKAQEYLADVLGEDWQQEYYVWDCCAGSGNLLVGLTNKYNIWASTIDKSDVDVMMQRIANGANLLESHVFQFDFLNDSFDKLPEGLQQIINDENKRKKLVIFINPPYADASSNMKVGFKKPGNSFTKTHEKYKEILSNFGRELFAQFLIRIYFEIPDCKIAEFSKLKLLTATHAEKMRDKFLAKLEKSFLIPAWNFDNVTGKFPVGFKIWNTSKKEKFKKTKSDIFDEHQIKIGEKTIYSYNNKTKINQWITEKKEDFNGLGFISLGRNDFQNRNLIFIINEKSLATNYNYPINISNLPKICVYFAVQKTVRGTWINDRDQFLFPNKKWEKDFEFQNDCLAYALLNNNIQSKYGKNHWIPFTEKEVDAKDKFASHFMTDFIGGKLVQNGYSNLFEQREETLCIKREFSSEANAVFNAGKEIWKYYHSQDKKMFEFRFGKQKYNVNASYYDIRAYFKGFESDKKGKERMNNKSADEKFNELEKNLSQALNILAEKIEPKVYEYEFLMK